MTSATLSDQSSVLNMTNCFYFSRNMQYNHNGAWLRPKNEFLINALCTFSGAVVPPALGGPQHLAGRAPALEMLHKCKCIGGEMTHSLVLLSGRHAGRGPDQGRAVHLAPPLAHVTRPASVAVLDWFCCVIQLVGIKYLKCWRRHLQYVCAFHILFLYARNQIMHVAHTQREPRNAQCSVSVSRTSA